MFRRSTMREPSAPSYTPSPTADSSGSARNRRKKSSEEHFKRHTTLQSVWNGSWLYPCTRKHVSDHLEAEEKWRAAGMPMNGSLNVYKEKIEGRGRGFNREQMQEKDREAAQAKRKQCASQDTEVSPLLTGKCPPESVKKRKACYLPPQAATYQLEQYPADLVLPPPFVGHDSGANLRVHISRIAERHRNYKPEPTEYKKREIAQDACGACPSDKDGGSPVARGRKVWEVGKVDCWTDAVAVRSIPGEPFVQQVYRADLRPGNEQVMKAVFNYRRHLEKRQDGRYHATRDLNSLELCTVPPPDIYYVPNIPSPAEIEAIGRAYGDTKLHPDYWKITNRTEIFSSHVLFRNLALMIHNLWLPGDPPSGKDCAAAGAAYLDALRSLQRDEHTGAAPRSRCDDSSPVANDRHAANDSSVPAKMIDADEKGRKPHVEELLAHFKRENRLRHRSRAALRRRNCESDEDDELDFEAYKRNGGTLETSPRRVVFFHDAKKRKAQSSRPRIGQSSKKRCQDAMASAVPEVLTLTPSDSETAEEKESSPFAKQKRPKNGRASFKPLASSAAPAVLSTAQSPDVDSIATSSTAIDGTHRLQGGMRTRSKAVGEAPR